MAQQRYIYPPSTIEGVEAIYANPDIGDGFTTTKQTIAQYGIVLDRTVSDSLELPKQWDVLHLNPNELATSASIFNIIDGFNLNFAYLNSRSELISNILPGNYVGYYTNNGDNPGAPIFKTSSTTTIPLTSYSLGGIIEVTEDAPSLSGTHGGHYLNELVTGTWVRDNTAVMTEYQVGGSENFHYGFLGSKQSITVVKMSNKPVNQLQPKVSPDGEYSGSEGWVVLDVYSSTEMFPTVENKLLYNNIVKIKCSDTKHLYVFDKGLPRAGVSRVSTSSQRSVIYRYDISGYLNTGIENSILNDKLSLVNMLGDVNTPTNTSDIVNPVAFTTTPDDNIIVYDEHDYTFKVYDKNNNFLYKHAKRNIVFRGASGTTKTYTGVSDIHYDKFTDQIYVLTPSGFLTILDKSFKTVSTLLIHKDTSNQGTTLSQKDLDLNYYKVGQQGDPVNENFLSLEFSLNEPNIYYVLTDRRVIKRFKSRDFDIGVFNFLDNGIGIKASELELHNIVNRASLKFLSVSQEVEVVTRQFLNDEGEIVYTIDQDRSYTYDQLYLYGQFVDIANQGTTRTYAHELNEHYIMNFKERINTRSCLSVNNYNIYELSNTTSLSFKEYNSDIVYNKLMYKLISNHLEFIEKINYRLSASYTPTGQLVYDSRKYLNEQDYRSLIIDMDQQRNMFVGVNEYFSSAVLNRCFQQLFEIQNKILNILKTVKNTAWPLPELDVPVEPFLFTNGNEYNDIDGKPYTGFYYIREQPSGDIYVQGRNALDGTTALDGSPTTDRYLNIKEP